jgi:hypothetical protein
LDFVKDQRDAMSASESAEPMKEASSRGDISTFTLVRLDDTGEHITRFNLRFKRDERVYFGVKQWQTVNLCFAR